MKKMTNEQRNEMLAREIREWLLKNYMWQDVTIYFNGKAYSTDDGNGHHYTNDPEHLIELNNVNPLDYFEYVNPETVSMSFEGMLYDVLNSYDCDSLEREFSKLFEKYGLYYELGNAWNLTCGEI